MSAMIRSQSRSQSLKILCLVALAYTGLRANAKQETFAIPSDQDSITLDLSQHFNNKAASGTEDAKGFDGEGNKYVKESLPHGCWVHNGIEFALPDWTAPYDNVKVDAQTIKLDVPVEPSSLHVLGVGEGYLGFLQHNPPQNITLHFADGSTDIISIEAKQWWGLHGTQHGDIIGHSRYLASGSLDYNLTQIFHTPYDIPIRSARQASELVSVTLPPSREYNALHIFALTAVPSRRMNDADYRPPVSERMVVRSVRGTKRHSADFSGWIVEVLVANPWSLSHVGQAEYWLDTPARIQLDPTDGLQTINPAQVHRLMPGEEVLVEVVVKGSTSSRTATVLIDTPIGSWRQEASLEGVLDGYQTYEPTMESTQQHSAPSWYRDAKFGIFIHWGPYAVPAWNAPPQYAEWYWYWLQTEGKEGATHQHHLDTYGPNFAYDQFLHQFTADQYNASAWVELFAAAGARYFVLTSKHHDGFALFDTGDSSNRNSLNFGPKRDLLKDLFDAAEAEQPQLHRGTYFSMPEWFAPSYHPIGKVLFPGGPPVNPYTGKPEPYTGEIKGVDFIQDVQYHQMRLLAEKYKTEIMWCDIGLSNNSYKLAADWYNEARDSGREVVMNDRCGIPADFDTPEMVHYSTVNKAFWESNMGMDPYSFGYTTTTKAEDYRSAANIIHTLIDIVSKGGNFLLNVGPTASGTIVEAMAEPLRGAGRWLSKYGEAVYGTHAIPLLPEYTAPGVDLRFLRKDDKLYIHSLVRPEPTLHIDLPLPILPHDDVCIMTSCRECEQVHWSVDAGQLNVTFRKDQLDRANVGDIAWVVQVTQKTGHDGRTGHDEL